VFERLASLPIASVLAARKTGSPSISVDYGYIEYGQTGKRGHTMRNGDSRLVICVFPSTSRVCLACVELMAFLNARTTAIDALTVTATLRPTFFSSFDDRTASSNVLIVRIETVRSCKGNNCANNSTAASTTAVVGGGGSTSWNSFPSKLLDCC